MEEGCMCGCGMRRGGRGGGGYIIILLYELRTGRAGKERGVVE